MDLFEAIHNRHSYRGTYSPEPIPRSDLEKIIRAGMAAPSGSDIRPWSFVVLQDPSKYEAIFGESNFNLRMYKDAAAVLVAFIGLRRGWGRKARSAFRNDGTGRICCSLQHL